MARKAQTDNDEQVAEEFGQPLEEDTMELRFIGTPYSGELMIGVEAFAVEGGIVHIPARLIAAAQHAGFQ